MADVVSARALLRRGQAHAAVMVLQRARSAATSWATPALGEIETLLGIALLEDGQPAAARAQLEDALWIEGDCCLATSVVAQDARLALARSLFATGSDRVRARQLATVAHAALARMGPSLDAKTRAAARWLDAHR